MKILNFWALSLQSSLKKVTRVSLKEASDNDIQSHICWRHIQLWLETFFQFLPYAWGFRRLWLLLRPLEFPKLFTEMSLNWKPLMHCTCLLRVLWVPSICLAVFAQCSSALPAPAFSFLIKTMGKSCWSTECAPTIREMLKLKKRMQNKRKKIVRVRQKQIQCSKSCSFFYTIRKKN